MTFDIKDEKADFADVKLAAQASHASQERIEDISNAKEHADELAELSGIEATAASKAAWLISITVSLGGLLFGTFRKIRHYHIIRNILQQSLTLLQVMILATFHRFL